MFYKQRKRTLAGVDAGRKSAQDWFFAVTLLITVLAVFVPLTPNLPREGLDQSWEFGMNQAVAQGLVFGRDIVFTFGPYASIYTKLFHPATDHLMVWGGLYLGVSFFLVAFLNFRDGEWYLRGGLLVTLAAIMYLRDALFFFYPLAVGIYLFKVTVLESVEQRNPGRWYALLIVLFAPLGLLPLVKGSALIACLAIIAFSAVLLIKEKGWRSSVVACVTPAVSMPLFWILADQPLSALPTYLVSMIPIISGYTEAMATRGDVKEILFYMAGAVLLLWCVLFDVKAPLFNRIIAAFMFLVVLFLAFKAGFVRHDGHAIVSSTTILMAALLACTMTLEKRASLSLIAAVMVWLYVDSVHIKTSTEKLFYSVKSTYSGAWKGLKVRIRDGGKLGRDFDKRIAELKSRGAFPLLDGTTDIYSYGQSLLIASGNRWNPRPILQSYSAYTAELVEKNKNHLLGDRRPDNILFRIEPMDGRVGSLEDGASWPALLLNYQPAAVVQGYLLLKHRPIDQASLRELNNISKNSHVLGEKIDLPNSAGLIFAKIHMRQTFPGWIWNTLFKPGQLEIKFTMGNGGDRTYRFIASMAKTGFLITPLIEFTEEYGFLYAGTEYLDDKRVRSISIDAKSGRRLWSNEFELEFLSLEYDKNPAYLDMYEFSRPLDGNELPKFSNAGKCDGSIDFVNGVSPAPASFKTRFLLNVHGWLAKSAEKGELPEGVYLVLAEGSGKRFFIKTRSTQRPDVGAHFNKRQLDSSGYAVTADVSMLKGQYVLGLAYMENGLLNICSEFNIPATIGAEGSFRSDASR